jgi:hypothetical protein
MKPVMKKFVRESLNIALIIAGIFCAGMGLKGRFIGKRTDQRGNSP